MSTKSNLKPSRKPGSGLIVQGQKMNKTCLDFWGLQFSDSPPLEQTQTKLSDRKLEYPSDVPWKSAHPIRCPAESQLSKGHHPHSYHACQSTQLHPCYTKFGSSHLLQQIKYRTFCSPFFMACLV